MSKAKESTDGGQRKFTRLAAGWRQEAEILRRNEATAQAKVKEDCAEQLEIWEREYQLAALSLRDAVKESGVSYSALQKMLADGRVHNVGEKHRPRIRRGDLPTKPGRLSARSTGEGPDLAGQILRQHG